MNQNQKVSLFDNPKLRKDIALKICEAINKLPDIEPKIKEEDIDALIANQDIITNYQKMSLITSKIDKMHKLRNNNSQLMSQNQEQYGMRYGYMLYENMDTKEDQIKNREYDIYTENKITRKKLVNDLILDELNMNINLLFPQSDAEALDYYLNNIKTMETGFLFTKTDLLKDLDINNPELYNICSQYLGLFQGNYGLNIVKSYKTFLKALVPLDKIPYENMLNVHHAVGEIKEILSSYQGQIKEFDDFFNLNEKDKNDYISSGLINISQAYATFDPFFNYFSLVTYELYKQNMFFKGMPFQKVFKKDGKVISLSQVGQYFDLTTKKLDPSVTIEDIDPDVIKKMQAQITLDKVNADCIYYKHILYELKYKEYNKSYKNLTDSINKYLNLVDEKKKIVQDSLALNEQLNPNEKLKKEINDLYSKEDFRQLEKEIQDQIKDFTKDLLDTNEKNRDMDLKIKNLYRKNQEYASSVNELAVSTTLYPHDDFISNAKALDEKIKEIENKRIEMASLGDKTSIRKANEEYYKAYEDLFNSDFLQKANESFKSYRDDFLTYKGYYDGSIGFNLDYFLPQMKYYSTIEKPETDFEKERLNQMNQFYEKYKDIDKDAAKSLKNDKDFMKEFKLSLRILCKYNKELLRKEASYKDAYDSMGLYKTVLEGIQENQFKNDYSNEENKLKIFIDSVQQIKNICKKIPDDIERRETEATQLANLFQDPNIRSFLSTIRSNKNTYQNEIDSFANEIKAEPYATLDREIDSYVNNNNYKDANRLAIEVIQSGNRKKENSDSYKKLDELNKKYPNDPDIKEVTDRFYEKNDPEYLNQSLKALSILNLKHEEYEHRGFFGKWWYKKSHNTMLQTRATLITQLQSKGILVKNLDKVGLIDNSFARNLIKETHLETIKEEKVKGPLEALYQGHFKEDSNELHNQLKTNKDLNKTDVILQEEFKKKNDLTNEMKKTATNNKK